MYSRICPTCSKIIFFKTKACVGKNNNKDCSSCAAKKRRTGKTFENWVEKLGLEEAELRMASYRKKLSKVTSGSNNPMAGKSVMDIWIEKHGLEEAQVRYNQHIQKMRFVTSGSNNPMAGKSVMDIWIEKHGLEEAQVRYNQMIKKISKSSTGSSNPMFGKPSPAGSGNGWSGWFKGYYFRSILELSYLKFLIDSGISFESGESKRFRISVNSCRNYFPDFYLIESKTVVEVKPQKLVGSRINREKFEAARVKWGDSFKIVTENDIKKLDFEEISSLYRSGDLKLIERYDSKFQRMLDERKGDAR